VLPIEVGDFECGGLGLGEKQEDPGEEEKRYS
jgi:hypothetical protein